MHLIALTLVVFLLSPYPYYAGSTARKTGNHRCAVSRSPLNAYASLIPALIDTVLYVYTPG